MPPRLIEGRRGTPSRVPLLVKLPRYLHQTRENLATTAEVKFVAGSVACGAINPNSRFTTTSACISDPSFKRNDYCRRVEASRPRSFRVPARKLAEHEMTPPTGGYCTTQMLSLPLGQTVLVPPIMSRSSGACYSSVFL